MNGEMNNPGLRLPEIINTFIIGQHPTAPDESLTLWARLTRTCVLYLFFDLTNGGRRLDRDSE